MDLGQKLNNKKALRSRGKKKGRTEGELMFLRISLRSLGLII
jgi:hypothetical protein